MSRLSSHNSLFSRAYMVDHETVWDLHSVMEKLLLLKRGYADGDDYEF